VHECKRKLYTLLVFGCSVRHASVVLWSASGVRAGTDDYLYFTPLRLVILSDSITLGFHFYADDIKLSLSFNSLEEMMTRLVRLLR